MCEFTTFASSLRINIGLRTITPTAGGVGMVLKPEPVVEALEAIEKEDKTVRILLTPQGTPFSQKKAEELAQVDQVVLVAGDMKDLMNGFDILSIWSCLSATMFSTAARQRPWLFWRP